MSLTTLVDVAALDLTREATSTFTLDQLLERTNFFGGPSSTYTTEDLRQHLHSKHTAVRRVPKSSPPLYELK
jgi:hypothetical protein